MLKSGRRVSPLPRGFRIARISLRLDMDRFRNYLEKPKWRKYLKPEGYGEALLAVYRIVAAALHEGCRRITVTADAVQLGTAQDPQAGREFTFGVDLRDNFKRVIARDPMMRKHLKCVTEAPAHDAYDVTD